MIAVARRCHTAPTRCVTRQHRVSYLEHSTGDTREQHNETAPWIHSVEALTKILQQSSTLLLTFRSPAWHTPANEHAGGPPPCPLQEHTYDRPISTTLAAIPASGLCGAVAPRDRCGCGISDWARGAYRLRAGRHVRHLGSPAGVYRTCVSRAWRRAAGGGDDGRVGCNALTSLGQESAALRMVGMLRAACAHRAALNPGFW